MENFGEGVCTISGTFNWPTKPENNEESSNKTLSSENVLSTHKANWKF
jgi:hypothetical protein